MEKEKHNLTIHNIKSGGYRQIHVDGAHGGVTPRGNINLSFYAERVVIPKGTIFEVTREGDLGSTIENTKESLEGFVREFEFGIYMDIKTAESLKEFLEVKIKELNILTKNK